MSELASSRYFSLNSKVPRNHYYERQLTPRLRSALRDTPAVLIHGPRQCGKTTLLIVGLALQLVATPNVYGQAAPLEESYEALAKHTIYAEFATMLFLGGVSVNYERMLSQNFSFRTGVGAGYAVDYGDKNTDAAVGILSMLNYMTAGSNYRFEVGIGLSANYFAQGFTGGDTYTKIDPGGIGVMPAFAIGYRYQQSDGGFFFRVGASYTYFMVTPLHFSFGHTF